MKQANEIIISVYSNVYSKQPVSKSLQEVLGNCLRPVYEPLIRSIRRYHEEGRTEDVQQLKKKLCLALRLRASLTGRMPSATCAATAM